MTKISKTLRNALLLTVLLLSACSGGGGGSATPSTSSYTIGGAVTGLSGSVVLQNNGGDDITVITDGNFTFASNVNDSGTYAVTVLTQPTGQTCSVSTGAGTVSGGNVSNVVVTCAANANTYTVGGTVSGLTGSVVLQVNSGDNLTVSANGAFTFATSVAYGSPYSVTVLTQPAGQNCSIANGTGTIAATNVSNVTLTCATPSSYTIGGAVTGLSGSVVLQNNGGDDITVITDGNFTFATSIADNSTYAVTVFTQPSGQTCSVSTGTGTVSGGNVSNVAVTCATNAYTVGGAVTGLSGSVVLQNNSGDDITVSADGNFTFAANITHNDTYAVTVLTQPTGQTCTVSTGTGTVSGNNVSNVAVTCSVNTYTVGGTVSGLNGSVTLQNNSSDNLTLSANGAYTFATSVAYNSPYSITVQTQPAGQSCSVANGTGTIAATNINNITLTCATHTHTVSGTVSGLNGSMVLQNNNGDDLAITTNGAFTFPTAVNYGSPYNVTPLSFQYPNQSCTMSNGSGTISANVSDVGVACAKFTVPRYVYTVSVHDGKISTYAVDAVSGRLKYIGKVDAAAWSCSVTVHPSGQYAYVGNCGSSNVSQYSIGADGALTAMVPATVATSAWAHFVTVDPTGKFAYATGGSGTVVGKYSIGADGALTATGVAAGTLIGAGSLPTNISAIDPTGKYAYVAVTAGANPGTVAQYTIGADGAWTAMTPASLATGVVPTSITVDLTGKYVYVVNQSDRTVSQYSIGTGGALAAIGTPVAAGMYPTSITVEPSGKYAYVASWAVSSDPRSNSVEQYSIGADGLLTHLATVPNWNGGYSIAVAAGAAPVQVVAKYAYVVNKGNNTVSQYTVGADGALTAMSTATVATGAGTNPTSITVDPEGKYAYVANGGDGINNGTVSQYSIGANGALTAMTTVSATIANPGSVAVDPAGRYAYVKSEGGYSQYTVGANGALTAMTVDYIGDSHMQARPLVIVHPTGQYTLALSKLCLSPFSVSIYGELTDISGTVGEACNVNWDLASVAVEPSGKYAYAANYINNTVAQFTIAANGGVALMATPTVAAGVNPKVVAVDPSGKYVYVANNDNGINPGTLSQYSIGATGGLTAIGTPLATGVNPQSITVDPSGKFAYVTNAGDTTTAGSISQYSIAADGTLTAMATVAAGVNPVSIATVGTYQ